MTTTSLARATADVVSRDPELERVAGMVGPLRYRPRDQDGPFGALVRTIVFQQLSGRSAQAILARVVAVAGGRLTPEAIAGTPDATLREAGLSAMKLAALRDLTTKALDKTLDLRRGSRSTNEELVSALISVRGIGEWSAQMYLIFELRRLDVWPTADLGVRQGYALIWALDTVPSPRALAPLGDRFRPYRTVVAQYCWEALRMSRARPETQPPVLMSRPEPTSPRISDLDSARLAVNP
jgi:DNA-3-methyladenine glycosylase II